MSHQKGGVWGLILDWKGFKTCGSHVRCETGRKNERFRILPNVLKRLDERRSDDGQNMVGELPSVIFRRSSWLSKKIMPRSVPVSYRRVTSVSKPVQL